jgi:methionine-rich copper-binding protein CopC
VAVAVVTAALVVAARACSAGAAPTLTEVEPANGSVLAAAPAGVSFVFTAPVDSQLVHVTVADARGVSVISGTARPSGLRVVVPVTVHASGEYFVDYHVALAGGRETSGLSGFTVVSGTGGTVTSRAGSTRRVPPDQTDAAGGHVHGSKDALSLAFVLVDAALIVAVLALLLRRPRPR